MADQRNDGGSAFPMPEASHVHGGHAAQYGMSLRDWFAGTMLPGLLASFSPADVQRMVDLGFTNAEIDRLFAMSAYRMADVMLAAREAKS